MVMLKSWEEGKAEARAEGFAEVRVEESAKSILTVLRVRGIEVPKAARERILAEQDVDQLTRWLERAALASMVEDVIDDQK
jgi:post-segregation antitoxin (ccd killing protein)